VMLKKHHHAIIFAGKGFECFFGKDGHLIDH